MTRVPSHVALVSEHASPLAPLGHPEAGGQNVYVDALARHLGRLGCRVDVYTRRDGADLPAIVDLAPGVQVHHLTAGPAAPVPRDELFPLMDEFAERLDAAWRPSPPEIVHAHFWMSGWASTVAAESVGIPVVQTFHALGSVKRRHQGAADSSPRERIPVERRLLRTVDTVVATCRDEVDELRRLGLSFAQVTVVPCGVGDPFTPVGPVAGAPAAGGRARFRLVCVSRLVPRKGVADAVRALALLRRDDIDAELVVVGGADRTALADDAELVTLAALAADLEVADRVHFCGRLAPEGVAAVLRSASVVVCAPWYEPFGIVPVEAMACGVPVVGTAVGGLLDTVLDGATGVLVPPRRPELLAAALAELLADDARRRRMGALGARRAAHYRWPMIARRLLEVYASTLGGWARPALRTDEALA